MRISALVAFKTQRGQAYIILKKTAKMYYFEDCFNFDLNGIIAFSFRFQKMKSKVKKAKKNYRKIRQKLKEKQQPRRVQKMTNNLCSTLRVRNVK